MRIQMRQRAVCAVALLAGLLTSLALPVAMQYETGVPKGRAAVGYLDLHKRDPESYEGPEEFVRLYSSEQALTRLNEVRDYLASFGHLTEQVRDRVSRTELEGVGNTDAETQGIAFHNTPLIVEGTILKQAYQLKQAEYELARMKHARGGLSVQEVDRARVAYAKA